MSLSTANKGGTVYNDADDGARNGYENQFQHGYDNPNIIHPQSYLASSLTAAEDLNNLGGVLDGRPEREPISSRFREDISNSSISTRDREQCNLDPRLETERRESSQSPPPSNNLFNSGMPSLGSLKKKPSRPSMDKRSSLKRSSSKRSTRALSMMSLGDKEKYGYADGEEGTSAFYTPIPLSGHPTEALATRFNAWRKVIKDLILFFREVQRGYETRSKVLISSSSLINNIGIPTGMLSSGGLLDATEIIRDYYRQALQETNKAKAIEAEIIVRLTGLRNDLGSKIKEINHLQGHFKSSLEKEMAGTKRVVRHFQDVLAQVDIESEDIPSSSSPSRGDPYLVKLAVDRQLLRQFSEESYLHQAYLNLESSGRDLECIIVGEIQKAYGGYASVLKRDADLADNAATKLRQGPISLPRDVEWSMFVVENENLVDPRTPLRSYETLTYPGKDHPAATEVRSGMLERKSKYLKSYTAGWYVLTPTHLHEFRSADRLASQTPVMSLYLPDQKVGNHSDPESSSHKFILKGRQTGSMHRGHSWIFRAESHDTMMTWYHDVKILTEKSNQRAEFIRSHARSVSSTVAGRPSYEAPSMFSDDGALNEEDETPYSAVNPIVRSSSHNYNNRDPALAAVPGYSNLAQRPAYSRQNSSKHGEQHHGRDRFFTYSPGSYAEQNAHNNNNNDSADAEALQQQYPLARTQSAGSANSRTFPRPRSEVASPYAQRVVSPGTPLELEDSRPSPAKNSTTNNNRTSSATDPETQNTGGSIRRSRTTSRRTLTPSAFADPTLHSDTGGDGDPADTQSQWSRPDPSPYVGPPYSGIDMPGGLPVENNEADERMAMPMSMKAN